MSGCQPRRETAGDRSSFRRVRSFHLRPFNGGLRPFNGGSQFRRRTVPEPRALAFANRASRPVLSDARPRKQQLKHGGKEIPMKTVTVIATVALVAGTAIAN